ncbi:carbon-nitrogen hydrolase family protein [Nakamurella endophytica]|uniref:Hydrolase n=1 Tax=Nakamurella endophytica TaxID=1748367 RepID=A0A917SUH9_9ACTN|nr:carbon-nitrogen hydrolase family protein [Nakamurella endophytica]GGL96803.1 hydrolase [Nakamurella endophytica]
MRIAVTQFDPRPDPAANAGHIASAAARAASDGADLLLAPEGSLVSFLTDPSAPGRAAQPLDGPFVGALAEASRRHGLAIAAGTFVPDPDSDRVHNTLVVLVDGELRAAYRKIHLYDAFAFEESRSVAPGADAAPVVELGGVRVGFATCYDLRFPELFRSLSAAGADVLALASAWVRGPLKEEHWSTLLRARAIENTCYVVAADQIGPAGIGRSAAFDPFGLPLLDLGTATPGYGCVTVNPERIREVRDILPSGRHGRLRIDPVPAPVALPVS